MHSKKLLVFLLLTINFNLYAFELDPPAPQPGDEEIVEVTVGEMRQALYYYELTPLMLKRIKDLNENINLILYEFDKVADAFTKSEMQRVEAVKEAAFYRHTTLAFVLLTIGLGSYIIGGSL